MTRPELIEQVKIRLNEMLPAGEGLEGLNLDEPTPVNDYINKLLDEAAQEVLLLAPTHLCPMKYVNQKPVGEFRVSLNLPDDFLRLIQLLCTGWEVPVTKLLEPEKHPDLYKMHLNPYVKGGKSKPAAFIKQKMDGTTPKKIVELFTCTADDYYMLYYVPVTLAETCSSRLQLVIAWLCAAKVLAVANRPESKTAIELYKRELELLSQ